MEEVPRRTSLVPLAFPCFVLRLIGLETKNVLDYQGRAGDHCHCTVERSPGHIRFRTESAGIELTMCTVWTCPTSMCTMLFALLSVVLACVGCHHAGSSTRCSRSAQRPKRWSSPWSCQQVHAEITERAFRNNRRVLNSGTKIQPKEEVLAGYPCGHPAKNFGQALQILEKEAFRHRHPARTSTKKLRSEKLRADFSYPINAALAKNAALVLSSKDWMNIQAGLQRRKINSKRLGSVFSLCCRARIDAALVRVLFEFLSFFVFASAPIIENQVKQKVQKSKVASAKVAFDNFRNNEHRHAPPPRLICYFCAPTSPNFLRLRLRFTTPRDVLGPIPQR